MKFALLSDTHESHHNIEIPPVDILIHSGDFTNVGSDKALESFNNWVKVCKARGIFKKIILVPGNHDLSLEVRPKKALKFLPDVDHVLVHQGLEIDGIKIWGTPYTPVFFNWAFMRNEGDLYWIYNQIPVNLDILICHGPPFGHCDWSGREHVGSHALAEVLAYKQPKYVVCGHIHEGRGVSEMNKTKILNVANMSRNYQPLPPVILELPAR